MPKDILGENDSKGGEATHQQKDLKRYGRIDGNAGCFLNASLGIAEVYR